MRISERRQSARIEVKDFPVIVVIDREGNNLYETAIRQYHTLEEM